MSYWTSNWAAQQKYAYRRGIEKGRALERAACNADADIPYEQETTTMDHATERLISAINELTGEVKKATSLREALAATNAQIVANSWLDNRRKTGVAKVRTKVKELQELIGRPADGVLSLTEYDELASQGAAIRRVRR
jgi:hypothetical protein